MKRAQRRALMQVGAGAEPLAEAPQGWAVRLRVPAELGLPPVCVSVDPSLPAVEVAETLRDLADLIAKEDT